MGSRASLDRCRKSPSHQGFNREPSKAKGPFFIRDMVAVLVSAAICRTETLKMTDTQITIERGNIRSHPVENLLWKRLRTCRKTGYRMNGTQITKMYTHVHTKKIENDLNGIHNYSTFWQKHGLSSIIFVFVLSNVCSRKQETDRKFMFLYIY